MANDNLTNMLKRFIFSLNGRYLELRVQLHLFLSVFIVRKQGNEIPSFILSYTCLFVLFCFQIEQQISTTHSYNFKLSAFLDSLRNLVKTTPFLEFARFLYIISSTVTIKICFLWYVQFTPFVHVLYWVQEESNMW